MSEDIRRYMQIFEDSEVDQYEKHCKAFYTELPGVVSDGAPFVVRQLDGEDGKTFAVYQQSHRVASARLSRDETHIVDLEVDPVFRRRGIATALYFYIENSLGHPLGDSPFRTQDGKAFWASRTDRKIS